MYDPAPITVSSAVIVAPAVVVFMGKQLNRIGQYDGKTSARETCEVLGIGFSDQVGEFQIR